MRHRAPNDVLRRARRADRRLAFAGLLLVACGVLIVGIGLLVVPFFFPLTLVVGGVVILVGWRLRGRMRPLLASAAAGISVLAGLAVIFAGVVALALGAVLVVAGVVVLAIVFADAGRFIESR
ncbi:MAG TPA: hypothetical protein VFX74_01450 [Candidatus Limnocylindria bacterium]|jgi:hypothetical protein|nr:hypothetical protein [Candidatus Limnocylindria bacterium]